MARQHVSFVGLMGTGKTTIGRRCARELDATFVDTDELVEAQSAMTVAQIFEAFGEAEFREREVRAVSDALLAAYRCVISCGGGAVLDPRNRSALREHSTVVWLDATPEVLFERVGRTSHRPLLANADPLATLTRLATLRQPSYEATAHIRIDTSKLDHDGTLRAVLDALTDLKGSDDRVS